MKLTKLYKNLNTKQTEQYYTTCHFADKSLLANDYTVHLMLRMLDKSFSRRHFEIVFPPECRLRYFVQIVSFGNILHEMMEPISINLSSTFCCTLYI